MLGKSKKQYCESIINDAISRHLPLRALTVLSELVDAEKENIQLLDDLAAKKEAAGAAIKTLFRHLRNLYEEISQLSDIKEIKKITRDLQFSVPLPKKDETIVTIMAHLMVSAIDRFNSIAADSYFLEEAYLELKRLKKDNDLYDYKNDLSKKENELFQRISKKLIEPYYDPCFDKMKKHFTIISSNLGLYYQCDIPLCNLKEYEDILRTLKKQDTLIEKVESFKNNFESAHDWVKDNMEDMLELIELRLIVFYELVEKLNACSIRKDNIKKGNISDFFPNIKAIFLLRENLDEVDNDLDSMLSILNEKKKELESLRKEKKSSTKKRRKKRKKEIAVEPEALSDSLEGSSILSDSSSVVAATSVHSYSSDESEKYVFLNKEEGKKEEKEEIKEQKQEIKEKPAENLLLHNYHRSKKQEKEEEPRRFSSDAEKMIQDIFDGSKKINYHNLVNFIKNTLNGEVNSKTKSSSRKLKIASGQTVFMHQRHGRDRKNYVPVETVKALKIVLENLGLAPEVPFSRLSLS